MDDDDDGGGGGVVVDSPHTIIPLVAYTLTIALITILLIWLWSSSSTPPRPTLRQLIALRTLSPIVDRTTRNISQLTKVSDNDLARFQPRVWTFRRDMGDEFLDHLESVLEHRLPLDRKIRSEREIERYAPEWDDNDGGGGGGWGRQQQARGQPETSVDYESMVDIQVQASLNAPAGRLVGEYADAYYHGLFHAPAPNVGSGVSDFTWRYHQAEGGAAQDEVEHTWSVESKVRGALRGCPLAMWHAATGAHGYRLKTVAAGTRTCLEGFAPAQAHGNDLLERIRYLSQQLVNEFLKQPVDAIIVHDLHEFILCRRSPVRLGEIILCRPINNSGPISGTEPQPPPRLVDKPFGLWLAMILDRDRRTQERLRTVREAEATMVAVATGPGIREQRLRRGPGAQGHHPPEPPLTRSITRRRARNVQGESASADSRDTTQSSTTQSSRRSSFGNLFRPLTGIASNRPVVQSLRIRVPSGAASVASDMSTPSSISSSDHSSFVSQAEKAGHWPEAPLANMLLVPPTTDACRAALFPFTPCDLALLTRPPSTDRPPLPPTTQSPARLCLGSCIDSGRIWDAWSGLLYPAADGDCDAGPVRVVIKIVSADPAYRRPSPSLPRSAWSVIDEVSWAEAELYRTALAPLQGKVVPRWLGLYDGQAYLRGGRVWCGLRIVVMEHVGGESSLQQLRKHRTEIAAAYHALHACGVVHRDVALRHIRLHDHRVVLLDFGEAMRVSVSAGADSNGPPPEGGDGDVLEDEDRRVLALLS